MPIKNPSRRELMSSTSAMEPTQVFRRSSPNTVGSSAARHDAQSGNEFHLRVDGKMTNFHVWLPGVDIERRPSDDHDVFRSIVFVPGRRVLSAPLQSCMAAYYYQIQDRCKAGHSSQNHFTLRTVDKKSPATEAHKSRYLEQNQITPSL
jgi:hypothetical protein